MRSFERSGEETGLLHVSGISCCYPKADRQAETPADYGGTPVSISGQDDEAASNATDDNNTLIQFVILFAGLSIGFENLVALFR